MHVFQTVRQLSNSRAPLYSYTSRTIFKQQYLFIKYINKVRMLSILRNRLLPFNNTRLITSMMFRFSEEKEGESGQPTEITKENAQLIIDKWVKDNKVVLFMKGTPHSPMCGYSNFVV